MKNHNDEDLETLAMYQGKTNEIARKALKTVAKQTGVTYQKVLKSFVNFDDFTEDLIFLFWTEVKKMGYDYNRVQQCGCCNKFLMWQASGDEEI